MEWWHAAIFCTDKIQQEIQAVLVFHLYAKKYTRIF